MRYIDKSIALLTPSKFSNFIFMCLIFKMIFYGGDGRRGFITLPGKGRTQWASASRTVPLFLLRREGLYSQAATCDQGSNSLILFLSFFWKVAIKWFNFIFSSKDDVHLFSCLLILGEVSYNCGKFFKRWEYQTTWSASWEICMQVRKQQLELDMEQQTGSK